MRILVGSIGLTLAWTAFALAEQPVVVTPSMHHVRQGTEREWSEFPETTQASFLEWKFEVPADARGGTIELRQQDVKQAWQVALNGRTLGQLARDENDMVVYFDVPVDAPQDGENLLAIAPRGGGRPAVDDIRVGNIRWHPAARDELLSAADLSLIVTDAESGARLPSRITVLNLDGALQTVGVESTGPLAVRPGTIYTATGRARFGLPPGTYRVFAGRGFEYSLDTATITLSAGQPKEHTFSIHREVPTEGYVACDTHIHSLTHSGHGDATVRERMITLAAEGIELPIATDHNIHIDHEPFAREAGVRRYFTPVIGNEVTTPSGHFNIFPVRSGAPIPDYKTSDWGRIFDRIDNTPGVKVAILNHARDTHSGVRPFGPKHFNDVVGENLDGWPMRFNAMEVINSSATQTDVLRLFHDWMALLNSGRLITPVGSSDSHDVARHFVGQGRTYIRCPDEAPEAIDVDGAVMHFLQGQVQVSYGLLADLTVEGKYGSGELARVPNDTIRVTARVLGPHWTSADTLILYSNGQPIREVEIPQRPADLPPGVQWRQTWSIPRPAHDVHLVAIALGPGIDAPYWRTAKPYQADSPDWKPRVVGCSGAVWIDADQDGRITSAREYARQLFTAKPPGLVGALERLANYDGAIAAQWAHWYQAHSGNLLADEMTEALKQAAPQVREGILAYRDAWRANQLARAGR